MIVDPNPFILFLLVFTVTLIIPGPNVVFCVAQSLEHGFSGALPAAFGFALGTACHALIVFSGIGIITANLDMLLEFVRWCGISYLLYLAYKSFQLTNMSSEASAQVAGFARLVTGAMLVSFTNPKGVAASLLIYTVFLSPEHSFLPQAVAMGVCAVMISFVTYGGYILMASWARFLFTKRAALGKLVGCVYLTVIGALLLL